MYYVFNNYLAPFTDPMILHRGKKFNRNKFLQFFAKTRKMDFLRQLLQDWTVKINLHWVFLKSQKIAFNKAEKYLWNRNFSNSSCDYIFLNCPHWLYMSFIRQTKIKLLLSSKLALLKKYSFKVASNEKLVVKISLKLDHVYLS